MGIEIDNSGVNSQNIDKIEKNNEKETKSPLIQSDYESFQKENSTKNEENMGNLNEIKPISQKPEHKLRYPDLAIDINQIEAKGGSIKNGHFEADSNKMDQFIQRNEEANMEFHTKQTEYQDLFTKNEDSLFFAEENLRFRYGSLKDKKAEFSTFLDNLGWKSRTYLKKNDDGREIGLQFHDKQDYIKKLNSNVCDFQETEGILKQNVAGFRDDEKNIKKILEPKIRVVEALIEKKWREKIKGTKERNNYLDYDLEFLLKNKKSTK